MVKKIATLALGFLCVTWSLQAPAWQHGIEGGYGYGQEVGADYTNTGFFANGIIYRFNKIDQFLIFTVNASFGNWYAHRVAPNKLTTFAISPNFRAYFLDPEAHFIRPYIQAAFGPVYLSSRFFGTQKQGSNYAFQTELGAGVEIGNFNKNAIDITVRFIHYCNAGLAKPNDGSDIPLVLTVGYLF